MKEGEGTQEGARSEIRLHLERTADFSSWRFLIDIHSARHTERGAQPVLLDSSSYVLWWAWHKVEPPWSVFL